MEQFNQPSRQEKKIDHELINNTLSSETIEIQADKHEQGAYIVSFNFKEAVTTIRFVLHDQQTDADMCITNITTLPTSETNRGYGTQALRKLIDWAIDNNLTTIVADQVQEGSERFWITNNFVKSPEPNPTGLFVYQL